MASLNGCKASHHDRHTSDAAWRFGWSKEAAILVRTSYGREEKSVSSAVDGEGLEGGGREQRRTEREEYAADDSGAVRFGRGREVKREEEEIHGQVWYLFIGGGGECVVVESLKEQLRLSRWMKAVLFVSFQILIKTDIIIYYSFQLL